jgi:hypothetical protein
MRGIRLLILLLFLNTFHSSGKTPLKFPLNKQLLLLENCIEEGAYNNAILVADRILKQKLTNEVRYKVLVYKSKTHFFEEDLEGFIKCSEKAYQLKKAASKIYKAYYYSQKAAFWHYHMIGDSAQYYSDKSMDLLRQNWNERYKIPFHFVYQIYGTTFLYRKGPVFKLSLNEFEKRMLVIKPMLLYLDSSLFYIKNYAHFSADEAIIHRSKGSRLLDVIGYKFRNENNKVAKEYYELSTEVLQSYTNALTALKSNNIGLKKNISSLIGLTYYCIGEKKIGDNYLRPYVNEINHSDLHRIDPFLIQNLGVLHYYLQEQALFGNRSNKAPNIEKYLENSLLDWEYLMQQQGQNGIDHYNNSPSKILIDYYSTILKNKIISNAQKQKTHRKILNLSLFLFKSFSKKHPFSKVNDYQYRLKKAQSELEFISTSLYKKLNQTLYSYTNFNIKKSKIYDFCSLIQNRLKKNEAYLYLLKDHADFYKEKKIGIITRDRIYIKTINQDFPEALLNPTISFKDFKLKSYEHYCNTFKVVRRILPNINKIYFDNSQQIQHAYMITDTIGNSYENLHFLSKKVSFVNVYNPLDFFSNTSSVFIQENLDVLVLDKNTKNQLPFSFNVLQSEKKKWKNFNWNGKQPFSKSGVLNFLGHGERNHSINSNVVKYRTKSDSTEFGVKIPNEINKELIVLNSCYSGFKVDGHSPNFYLIDKFLFNGAKAVIASRYALVDKSSAEIMGDFYLKLKAGFSVEDALYTAKQNYFKSHTGEQAHPIFWAGLQLTSNVKDLRLAPEPATTTDKSWQAFLVLLALVAMVLRFYLFWES